MPATPTAEPARLTERLARTQSQHHTRTTTIHWMTDATPTPLPAWPNVPDCHGWLSLDARGRWRLKGERVEHGGLLAFLNANYACDDQGNWLVHNGPQRVYVELEAAPWILRLLPDGTLQTQDGQRARADPPVLVDAAGRVSLGTDLGPASLDDRDLALFLAELADHHGRKPCEETLDALLEGRQVAPLRWRGLPVSFAPAHAVPGLLGFRRSPAAVG